MQNDRFLILSRRVWKSLYIELILFAVWKLPLETIMKLTEFNKKQTQELCALRVITVFWVVMESIS